MVAILSWCWYIDSKRRSLIMPIIYNYSDYHTFLADWFMEKKRTNKSFSYTRFAEEAGFRDRGFLHNVIHGKRDLTKASLIKVVAAIGLTISEAEYFENMVFFNKASNLNERRYFFEKMNQVRSGDKAAIEACRLRTDQYEFYAEWHHSAIRSLIDMYPAHSSDYGWLAKKIYPPISVKTAKKSVELLLHLGLVEPDDRGGFRLTSKSITTGREVKSLAVQQFHKHSADLAKRAIEVLPPKNRNITGLTLGISEPVYRQICDEIEAFRAKIVTLAEADDHADRTYQLNVHLFPVTKTDISPAGDK